MTTAVQQKLDRGLIAFTLCDHGEGLSMFPCHVIISALVHVNSCGVCSRIIPDRSIRWLTTDEAKAIGWNIMEARPQ